MGSRLKGLALCALTALALLFLPVRSFASPEGGVYKQVSDAPQFATALQDIENSDVSEAIIELTADIQMLNDFRGIEGKKITVRSAEGSTHMLAWPNSSDTVELKGDVTLENVHISPKTLYAQGHHLTLGEGFGGGEDGQKRMIVYGGSKGNLTANTHVTVLDGVYKLIAGGNSAGTLTGDTHVEFGGSARFPNASEGKQEGDFVGTKSENYNLYLDAKGEDKWNGPVFAGMDYEYGILPYGIYGGGTCGNTNGSTRIEMTGGTVYQIFGGGAARRNPSHAGSLGELDDLGRVSGNTSVTITGGEVKSVYGGGYNDIFVFSSYEYEENGVPANARNQRAVVEGDAYVEISGNAHVAAAEQSEDTSSSGADYPAVYGGSFHSTISNTQVVIGGDARVESGEGSNYGYGAVYGAGCNDIILGTTSALLKDNAVIGSDKNKAGASVVSQGKFSALTPMGRTSESRCYLGGALFDHPSEIQNSQNKHYAATAEVSGGSVDVLMAGVKSRKASKQPMKTCNGNVQLKQSGGAVLSIESGSVYEKNLVINGNADILVTGGTTEEHILGRYRTSDLGNSEIKGACTLTFSGCGSADAFRMSPLIWSMDSVRAQDNAHVAVFGDHTLFDSNKKPFTVPLYQIKDLTVDDGSALAFKQEANITGNLVANGQLNMARVKKSINIGGTEIPIGEPKAVTLTAAGTACGNGMLLPIENPTNPKDGSNYSSYSEPTVNEEYVYARTVDSDMNLSLEKGADKFFVDRKNSKTAGQDVWFINEQVVQDVTVTFDKNGGDTEADPTSITVTSGSTVGTLPMEPTRANHTFLGWNTQADGGGEAFTVTTPVTSDITVYAQWEETPEQNWYYEVYYQLYSTDGDQLDENGVAYSWMRCEPHELGGQELPNATVKIEHARFDGTELDRDAIDGSGKETLGIHYVYDENFGPHRLSATCAEATKSNPLKIYYRAAPHKVIYEYLGTVPDGAPEPPSESQAPYSSSVDVKPNPTLAGYQFSGWEVQAPTGTEITNGKLTMPSKDVILAGTWTKLPIPPTPEEKIGNLTISKTVLGNGGETDRDFHFTLALSDRSINGVFGDISFSNGVANITLKHGESKTAAGLPVGLNYEVAEAEANQDGYTTTSAEETGSIVEGTTRAVFTNSRNTVEPGPGPSAKVGNLTVSKTVTGDKADTSRNFAFSVTLDDPSINGAYGDMEFRDGVAIITLAHGESKTATGLPAGIDYLVEEEECPDYTVTKTGDTGTIEANATALASFANHYKNNGSIPDPDPNPDNPNTPSEPDSPTKPGKPSKPNGELPQTGDTFTSAPALGLALMGAIAVVVGIRLASIAKKRP